MLGESIDDWKELERVLRKAYDMLYRYDMRNDLTAGGDVSNKDVGPDFSILLNILTFYQEYRKLEMEFFRFYPDEYNVRQNLSPELDGYSRDGTEILAKD